MNTFQIQLAGKIIELSAQYPYLLTYCSEYLVTGTPDLSIAVQPADIAFEREKSRREDLREGIPVRGFSDDCLEATAAYRKIADALLAYDILVFHGSAVAVDGVGYLFTAKSGTGKSTHTALWQTYFGERAVMINDDKPLLAVTAQGVTVSGTPWNGKHFRGTNMSAPLRAICILERAEENRIEPISAKVAYPMLVQQVNRPSDPQKLQKTLRLIDRLSGQVRLFRLGCNMDISAVETAYRGMCPEV